MTEETKKKLREANIGKHLSEETKKKLSESHKGQTPWNKGVPRDEETKKKISETMKKVMSSEETRQKLIDANTGKHLSEETKKKLREANIGKHLSEETKQKLRESMSKYLEEVGFTRPNIGRNETQILDKLEEKFGYKILRQYKVGGYFLDGYIPELNMAIEIDEEHHKYQKERDIKREEFIIKQLGCTFYRIKD